MVLPDFCFGSFHKQANPGPMQAVYGLVDPRTDEIRYVGSTSVGALARSKGHLCNRAMCATNPKQAWTDELRRLGLEWRVVILEGFECGNEDAVALAKAEEGWMFRLRDAGAALVNTQWPAGTERAR